MALYKYQQYLKLDQGNTFDQEHPPGSLAPLSGIYRCMGCGKEVASNQQQPLPPQNHHQHTVLQGTIRWKLVVFAYHNQS